jgi:DNA polymerase sigma
VVPTGGKNLFNMRLPDVVDRAILVETMKRFFRELTNMDSSNEGVRALKECLEDVKIIETASVPVIKLVIDLQKIRAAEFTAKQNPIEEDMRLLKIDITFDDSQNGGEFDFFSQGFQNSFGPPPTNIHMGIRCCQFVKKKLEEYSALESLTLVLKKFLALRNMNQPYQGGLNSYGLIILIVTFLNLQLADFYSKEGALSFARVLKGFLFYFGKQFDSNFNIISEQQQIVHEINYSSILVIRDPLNPLNNIGKSTFNFENIRAEFVKAHDEIERHLQEFILSQSPACIAVEEGAAQ